MYLYMYSVFGVSVSPPEDYFLVLIEIQTLLTRGFILQQ